MTDKMPDAQVIEGVDWWDLKRPWCAHTDGRVCKRAWPVAGESRWSREGQMRWARQCAVAARWGIL